MESSLSLSVRERLLAKLHQKQIEGSLSGSSDKLPVVTRFDGVPLPPISLSPSPLPPISSAPPSPSEETRQTQRWKLLSQRLPEAIERTEDEQAYLFFTGTVEDLELPAPRRREKKVETEDGTVEEEGEEEEEEGTVDGDNDGLEDVEEREESRSLSRDHIQGTSEDRVSDGGIEEEGEGEGREAGVEEEEEEEESGDEEGGEGSITATGSQTYYNTQTDGGQRSIKMLHPPTMEYIPHQVRLERDRNSYFTPSAHSVTVAVQDRTLTGLPPRYRDNEGFYMGQRPRVNLTNQIIVENRILNRHDKGSHWFGEDGLLLSLPRPLQETELRPDILNFDPEKNICWRHQVKQRDGVNSRTLIPKVSGNCQLDLTLSTLNFTHHPLFSMEHVLTTNLRQLCGDYLSVMDRNASDYLLQKLYALKSATVDLQQRFLEMGEEGSEEIDEIRLNLRRYSRQVRCLRREWREREATKHRLLLSILRMWAVLKNVRDSQGYASTTLSISFRRQVVDGEEEQVLREREIAEEVEEEREKYMSELPEKQSLYEAQLTEWSAYMKERRKAIRDLRRQQQALQQQLMATDGEGGEEGGGTVEGEGEVEEEEREQEDQEERQGEENNQSEQAEEVEMVNEEEEEDETELIEGSQTTLTAEGENIPPHRPKPQPPAPFNESQIQQDLVQYYAQHTRPPGHPILYPIIQDTHSSSQSCPRGEEMRRLELSRIKLKIKVFYNEREVCTTKEYTLGGDFVVHFNETFHMEIVHWPRTIKLQIMECSLFSSSLLAELFLTVPSSDHTHNLLETYHFSSEKRMPPLHTAVGSGERLPSLPERGVLLTGGDVKVGLSWAVDKEGRVMCPPELTAVKESSPSITNIAQLKNWAEEATIDPNDPRNAQLLNLLQSVPASDPNSTDSDRGLFRLRQLHEKERFVSDQEFTNERRFSLLEHRQQGHPELKNKSVPIAKEYISASLWKAIQEYQPYKDYDLPPTYQGDFHGNRCEERNCFLLQIRERVLSKVRAGRAKLKLEDVIHYDIIPNISGLKATLMEFLAPRRPLKPRRKPTRKAKAQNQQISEAKIVVRVVRAFGVPIRTHNNGTHSSGPIRGRSMSVASPPGPSPPPLTLFSNQSAINRDGERMTGVPPSDDHLHSLSVSPFVEVSMTSGSGTGTERTTTAAGTNPYWNEELTLSFCPPFCDFSPENLAKVTESIQINLYDEVIIDLLQDDRDRQTNIHQRREKKWLGSFTLPFSTLHARTRIEGTFALQVPKLLLGYSTLPGRLNHTHFGASPAHQRSGSATHLQLFISLEPPLSTLPPIRDLFSSTEEPHLLRHARQWLKNLHNHHPDRHYLATVLDSMGRHVIVTRYIHPQSPPVEICPAGDDNQTQAMELLAHYVSLIPFLPDALTFSGECDIWTTSDQFLHMLAGDEEEHAVLLTNYFLHCGWSAWLVLGHGIPEGPTAYVLTKAPDNGVGYWLWNASTGQHTSQLDPHCPLTSVGCIINKHNVLANVQQYSNPGRISFDISNHKLWSPLFSSSMKPLDTIQRDLVYDVTEQVKVCDLQEAIEREIRDHIMSLRSRFITRWNNNCGRILHRMLVRYEDHFSDPQTFRDTSELDELTNSYSLSGYPLHYSYANILHIVSSVERTGLHLTEHRQTEFGLSVYVHPYPNDVVSVWVFLVTLEPK